MKKNIKYEEAVRELENIVAQMENGQLDIDTLSARLARAQELVEVCKSKLLKTDNEIKKLLDKGSNGGSVSGQEGKFS
ncbi:MAG: exodeoxyribonuclease VII small subunit [Prevotella sp.]|nr:exodeoxyribonuclease VII small subunit [Prevotella sp.]MDY2633112.1 exodeoxyribonuclease VII small subunit [Prevotella sp.]